MKKLENKVALVTGSGSGIGKAIAERFAKEGAKVMLNDINEFKVKQTIDEIEDFVVDYIVGDVSRKEVAVNMVRKTVSQFGSIDILVNNAGGGLGTPRNLEEIEEQDWDKVLDVNLKGTFLTSQAAVGFMKENGGGKIINIASIAGRYASSMTGVAYAAAKGGVISFTRKLAKEVGIYGINVNVIAPGIIMSGERLRKMFFEEINENVRNQVLQQIPLGVLGENEDIVNAAVFLATDDSKYITGSVLDVNGGLYMG